MVLTKVHGVRLLAFMTRPTVLNVVSHDQAGHFVLVMKDINSHAITRPASIQMNVEPLACVRIIATILREILPAHANPATN